MVPGRPEGGESGCGVSWEEVSVEDGGCRVEYVVEERGERCGRGEASSVEEDGTERGGGTGGAKFGSGVICEGGAGLGVLGLGPEKVLC